MSKENTIDYLENIQIHQFPEDMSIYEAALETCLLAEANWAYIVESTITDEYKSYEAAILKEEETSLTPADDTADDKKTKNAFFEKCKEAMKKIASYISGLFSKFVVAMGNLFHKNAFLTSREAQAKMEAGLKNIENNSEANKSFEGFILDHGALSVLQNNTKGVEELAAKIGRNEFLNNLRKIDDVKIHLDNGYEAAYKGLLTDTGMDKVIEKNKEAKDSLKKNLIAMLSFNKGMDELKGETIKYSLDNAVYKTCLDNFQNSKFYTTEAKNLYAKSKSTLNTAIASIDNLKKYTTPDKSNAEIEMDTINGEGTTKLLKEQSAKMAVETLNKIGKLLARTNGIVLTLLKQDYTTCCKVLLTLYNAGKAKSKEAEPVNASAIFRDESIESIFSTTAFI